MTLSPDFLRSSLLFLSAGLFGVAVGCTVGSDVAGAHECGGVGSHSEINEETEECECDTGYDWCNPDDPDDFECCPPEVDCPDPNSHAVGDTCVCDAGYEWCNPDDLEDLSCCEEGDGGTGTDDGGTGTGGTDDGGTDTGGTDTGGGDDCGDGDPPPAEGCTADEVWCTSTDENCPGEYYVCDGGEWVLDAETGDLWCTDEGYDFQHGCYDDGVDTVFFICDYGPGTPCDGNDVVCVDSDVIQECKHGSLTEDSCLRICQEVGDGGGSLYDWGECGEQDGSIECLCCDYDDPECGDGGGTGTATDTGTGS